MIRFMNQALFLGSPVGQRRVVNSPPSDRGLTRGSTRLHTFTASLARENPQGVTVFRCLHARATERLFWGTRHRHRGSRGKQLTNEEVRHRPKT